VSKLNIVSDNKTTPQIVRIKQGNRVSGFHMNERRGLFTITYTNIITPPLKHFQGLKHGFSNCGTITRPTNVNRHTALVTKT
jgi:hypothetical protein